MGPLAGRAPVTSWQIWFVAIFSRSHCIYDKKIEWQLLHSTLFLHCFYIKQYSFYHKCAHFLTNIFAYKYPYAFKIFFPHIICDSLYVYVYEQFSLQPVHPCFKIDHVRSSGKFSYMFIMFIMYMVIADEDKKKIWKVFFSDIKLYLKNTGVTQTFYGRNADIWYMTGVVSDMHTMHKNISKQCLDQKQPCERRP